MNTFSGKIPTENGNGQGQTEKPKPPIDFIISNDVEVLNGFSRCGKHKVERPKLVINPGKERNNMSPEKYYMSGIVSENTQGYENKVTNSLEYNEKMTVSTRPSTKT